MDRLRLRLGIGLALSLITFFTVVTAALALDWDIRKGPMASTGAYGTVHKVSTTRYRVYKGDSSAGRVVKVTSTKWSVFKGDKKVGTVRKLSDTKFAFYNGSGTRVGLLKPSNGLWIIYKVVPIGGTSDYALIILGNADKGYPGAPTMGAGRILLWN
jgi:hypothetical protein